MGQHFHIHLYDAPTTQAEKIARVRALYERPGKKMHPDIKSTEWQFVSAIPV